MMPNRATQGSVASQANISNRYQQHSLNEDLIDDEGLDKQTFERIQSSSSESSGCEEYPIQEGQSEEPERPSSKSRYDQPTEPPSHMSRVYQNPPLAASTQ